MKKEGKTSWTYLKHDGEVVNFLLDSGASHCFLSRSFAEEKKLMVVRGSNEARVFLADNTSLPILGTTQQTVTINNQDLLLTFRVVEGLDDDVVLGADFLEEHGVVVDWKRKTLIIQDERTQLNVMCATDTAQAQHGRTAGPGDPEEDQPTLHGPVRMTRMDNRTNGERQTDQSNEHRRSFQTEEQDEGSGRPPPNCNGLPREHLRLMNDQENPRKDSDNQSKPTLRTPTTEPYELCKRNIEAVMKEYTDVFAAVEGLPPYRAGFDFKVEFLSEPPIPAHKKPYRLSDGEMQALVSEIDRLLELGYIEATRSEWSAPVLFAKKRHKDAKLRMCVDFRGLNTLTRGIHYPLPLITEAIDALQGHVVFSVFDISKAFQQIRVVPGHEDYLTLTCPLGQYRFKVMTFGLRNASGHFQHLIMEILRGTVPLPSEEYRDAAPNPNLPDLTDNVVVFMDDLNVCSRSLEDHPNHVRLLLERLRIYGFKLNEPEDIATPNVSFLGYAVGRDGLKLPEDKAKSICDWPDLQSRKNIQEFLGAVGYFRRFLPDFANLATPLTDLTGKNSTFNWGDEQRKAFQNIKDLVKHAMDLHLPDATKPFFIATDASKCGIGAVLMQMHEESFRPIEFYSRKLAGSQRNWPSYESELYAIIQSLRHWRHYVDGRSITIFSDHKPLEKVLLESKLHSRKVANWISELLPYDLTLVHHAGTSALGMVPDALSRRPDYIEAALVEPSPSLADECQKLFHRKMWTQDPTWLQEIRTASGPHTLKGEDVDGIYYLNGRIVIPPDPELRRKLLTLAHGEGHRGAFAMRAFLRRRFWWSHLNTDVRDHIRHCDTCSQYKNHKQKETIMPQPTPEGPWDVIGLDFAWMGKETDELQEGFASVVDKFGKGVYLLPVQANITGEEFAKLLFNRLIAQRGAPKEIISDRDVRFTGEWWNSFFEVLGTKLKMTVAHRPKSDGLAERMHQTVAETLRCMKGDWKENLPMVEYVLNSNVPSPFRLSPMEMYGRTEQEKMRLFDNRLHCASDISVKEYLREQKQRYLEATEILERVNDNMARTVNKGHTTETFEVGEKVMLSTKHLPLKQKKLGPRYVGPLVIEARRGDVTYKLKLPEEWLQRRIHDEFNVNMLRKYFGSHDGDDDTSRTLPELENEENSNEETFEIEEILKHRKRGKRKELLVKWSGYETPSWTDLRILMEDAPEYVADYFASGSWSKT